MPTLLSFLISIALTLLGLHPSDVFAAASERVGGLRDREDVGGREPCNEAFPLAPASPPPPRYQRLRRRVLVPGDPTRRSHAPLCPDGVRIDVRRLERCPGGTCFVPEYDQCLHSTSRECQLLFEALAPTQRPTLGTVETVHPVRLVLRDVPKGYRPSPEVRSIALEFVKESLEERLGEEGLELVRVEHAGRLPPNFSQNGGRNLRPRRLEDVSISIPLRVTVRGPTSISDLALSYIMDAIRDGFDDLKDRLKNHGESMDGGLLQNTFNNIKLSTDTYNFADLLTAPTVFPSGAPTTTEPTTSRPTARPTKTPTDAPTESPSVAPSETLETIAIGGVATMDAETTKMPWWAWLLIALVILLLCICCVLCCVRKRRKDAEEGKAAVNVWVQNGSVAGTKDARRRTGQNPPPRTRRRAPRKAPFEEEGARAERSSMPRPSRTPIRRQISWTEAEEEARREREHRHYVVQRELEEKARRQRDDRDPPVLTVAAANRSRDAVDPPEENSLVPYDPGPRRHFGSTETSAEEPEGAKAAKATSMYASELYHASDVGSAWESRSEDPHGRNIAKHKCMFVSEACPPSPVADGEVRHRKPRRPKTRRAPSKDTLFTCSMEELREEVRPESRSVGGAERDNDREGREKRKKKRKKSKKKDRSDPKHGRGGRPQDVQEAEGNMNHPVARNYCNGSMPSSHVYERESSWDSDDDDSEEIGRYGESIFIDEL